MLAVASDAEADRLVQDLTENPAPSGRNGAPVPIQMEHPFRR
jgi:hypothetical protein